MTSQVGDTGTLGGGTVSPAHRHLTWGRSRTWLLMLCIGAVTTLTGRTAVAQETARDFVEPIVDRASYTTFMQDIGGDRSLREIAELLYDDYLSGIDQLLNATDAAAVAAGRGTVDDALTGRVFLAPEELRGLRLGVLEAYRQSWPTADALYDDLLLNIELQLDAAQADRMGRAQRAMERDLFLEPMRRGGMNSDYAGDGVDLMAIYLDATEAELEPFGGGTALADVWTSYERALASHLRTAGRELRQLRFERRRAGIERDVNAQRQAEAEQISLWSSLYGLNQQTAEAVRGVVESNIGVDAANAWMARVNEATWPWLYERSDLDRTIGFLETASLSQEQVTTLNALLAKELKQRDDLRATAVAMMVSARETQQMIVHPMMDPAGLSGAMRTVYSKLVQNSGEISEVERVMSETIDRMLTDEQRKDLRRVLRRRR